MTLHQIRQTWTPAARQQLLRDLGFIGLCVVLANLTGIVEPSLNVDDYSQFGGHASGWHAHGRWLLGPFFEHVTLAAYAPPLLTFLGSVVLAGVGLIIALIFNVKAGVHRVIVGALFGCHPYFIDMMNFNTAVLAYPLSFLLILLAVLASNVRPHFLFISLGSVLVCCSLALYQASLGLLATVSVFAIGMMGLRAMDFPGPRVWVRIIPLIAIAIVGVVLYVIITIGVVESGSERTEIVSSWMDVQAKLFYLYWSLMETMLSDEMLMPVATKTIFGILVLVMAHAAWSKARGEGASITRGVVFVVCVLVVMGLVLFASYAVVLPLKVGLPPRAMVGHALLTAVVAVMVFSIGLRHHRVLGIVLGGVLVFQYAIIANELMHKQSVLQQIDMSLASSLSVGIASEAGFQRETTYEIVVLGERDGPWQSQSSVLQSAFSRSWASRDILKLYGIRTTSPSDETTDWARAQSFEMGIWPSGNSIRLEENRIVVRLD